MIETPSLSRKQATHSVLGKALGRGHRENLSVV